MRALRNHSRNANLIFPNFLSMEKLKQSGWVLPFLMVIIWWNYGGLCVVVRKRPVVCYYESTLSTYNGRLAVPASTTEAIIPSLSFSLLIFKPKMISFSFVAGPHLSLHEISSSLSFFLLNAPAFVSLKIIATSTCFTPMKSKHSHQLITICCLLLQPLTAKDWLLECNLLPKLARILLIWKHSTVCSKTSS